jgi:hypothetical protein
MDWIENTQRLVSIQQNCLREALPFISIVYLYIDKQKSLHSSIKDTIHFASDEHRVLSKEKLLQLVQSHKKDDVMNHYILKDTFLFHIPIEPEDLSRFDEKHFDSYWKSFHILEDIELHPSIFIFHPYNTLYFVYYEEEKNAVKHPKSALKQHSSGRITKRVRWAKHQRKTRGRGNPCSL